MHGGKPPNSSQSQQINCPSCNKYLATDSKCCSGCGWSKFRERCIQATVNLIALGVIALIFTLVWVQSHNSSPNYAEPSNVQIPNPTISALSHIASTTVQYFYEPTAHVIAPNTFAPSQYFYEPNAQVISTSTPIPPLPNSSTTQQSNQLTRDPNFPFQFLNAEKDPQSGRIRFVNKGGHGTETVNVYQDSRRDVPSENQSNYPEAESGCGPTAILNWILWYQKYRMLSPLESRMSPDLQRWQSYRRIEEEIFRIRSQASRSRGATTDLEIISAFDRTVYKMSDGSIRMHYEITQAPISIQNLRDFTSGFRAAILIVETMDGTAGRPTSLHAVSVAAGDTNAYLMVNNWGKKLYGSLRIEKDGQYFYPRDGSSSALRIKQLITFIPVRISNREELAITDLPLMQTPHRSDNPPFARTVQRTTTRPAPATPSYTQRPKTSPPRPSSVATNPAIPPQDALEIMSFGPPFYPTPHPHRYRVNIRNNSNNDIRIYLGTLQGLFSDNKLHFPSGVFPDSQQQRSSTAVGNWNDTIIPARSISSVEVEFHSIHTENLRLLRVLPKL